MAKITFIDKTEKECKDRWEERELFLVLQQWQIYEENSRFLSHNTEALHCATGPTHWEGKKNKLSRAVGFVALILLRMDALLEQALQDQEEALTAKEDKAFTNFILLLTKNL